MTTTPRTPGDDLALPAVALADVTRRFPARRQAQHDEVVALDRVSLRVETGDLFGLLGPNGAGKTTLLRLITTLLVPSTGRVWVCGLDAARQPREVRRRIGVVLGGERSVYWRLTGRENIMYAAALHDLPEALARERAAALLALVDLADRADDLVERYSTGMRLRLALARALVHDPLVLVLDEPTAGLDPQAAAGIRTLLAALTREHTRTTIMATHNLDEAERLCGTVGILDRGRLIACATPASLKTRLAQGSGREAVPTLEAVFLELTGRSLAAADARAVWP
jgi:ABC-2 type transport system ATP-binding protein